MSYVDRINTEKSELEEKIEKLHAFIEGNPVFQGLPPAARDLLKEQLSIMQKYSDILRQRIFLALANGKETIKAVRFERNPSPDSIVTEDE
jgi:hypothetical protein